MELPPDARGLVSAVLLVAAGLAGLAGCRGSSPSPGVPPAAPGAITVNGTERLVWTQTGDVAGLQFLAYVDDHPAPLGAVTCNRTAQTAECSAALPSLHDGVHTIALSAISAYGFEGERSAALTVQKVSARSAVSAASFPDARISSAEPRLDATVSTSDGSTFVVDVIARGLQAPLQLAWIPDGRLLIAESTGRIQVIRPDQPDRRELTLDAHGLLDPSPVGPLGLAIHPDFAQNRFVYVSFLAREDPGRTVLRIVRLRETGDRLGEPATLFEAPIVVATQDPRIAEERRQPTRPVSLSADGPRLAFGPDGLLYALLPPGLVFDREPSASRPVASMVRLDDNGRMPAEGPLSGVAAPPLGFAWHPSTAALWIILPDADDQAVIRAVAGGPTSGVDRSAHAVLRMSAGASPSSGALVFQEAEAGTLALARTFAAGLDTASLGPIRLATPILIESVLPGMSGRIGDVVAGHDGTLFLATSDDTRPGAAGAGADVVLRLVPVPR